MAIPSPKLVNYILSRLVCSCYHQYLHVLFREIHNKVVHVVVRVQLHSSFFILSTEFHVARVQTKCCGTCPAPHERLERALYRD